MARPQDKSAHAKNRERLLEAGEMAFRSKSYEESGINEVLKDASVPKGSFYHHFASKEDFGVAVARRYHERQIDFARDCFGDHSKLPIDRLKSFFEGARADMGNRAFKQGCLMCNLTTELAGQRPVFQAELDRHWHEIAAELNICLTEMDLSQIGLAHLTSAEAADWLMNAWSGALTRMKASGDDQPLALFLRTIFKQ